MTFSDILHCKKNNSQILYLFLSRIYCNPSYVHKTFVSACIFTCRASTVPSLLVLGCSLVTALTALVLLASTLLTGVSGAFEGWPGVIFFEGWASLAPLGTGATLKEPVRTLAKKLKKTFYNFAHCSVFVNTCTMDRNIY